MGVKNLLLLILALSVTACAGASLKKDWKEKRGYSDQDIDSIMNQYGEYNQMNAQASVASNAFNSAPVTEARARLRKIFCACTKKIGEKCREKPDGLAGPEKALWIKANAADMAFVGNSMSFETNAMSTIDPAECE